MIRKSLAALGLAAMVATPGLADEEADLVVNEDIEMTVRTAAPAHMSDVIDTIYSGWVFRSSETQSLQMDDFDNPGMIFVDQGRDTWAAVDGSEGKSCASCHGEPEDSMVGLRAVYPKWHEGSGQVRTMEMAVNDCRENRMGAENGSGMQARWSM